MKKLEPIKWKSIEVNVKDVKETPGNFKLWDEEGASRFKTSIEQFGVAGTIIINTDMTLVDGNTRLKKAKEQGLKRIWASVPSRYLKPKEFLEMAALFDYARAGQVDIKRIKDELGDTASFFKKWGLDIDTDQQRKLDEMDSGKVTANKGKVVNGVETIKERVVNLIFTPDEAKRYLEIAESLYTKFKVDNPTDLSMAVLLFAKKNKK